MDSFDLSYIEEKLDAILGDLRDDIMKGIGPFWGNHGTFLVGQEIVSPTQNEAVHNPSLPQRLMLPTSTNPNPNENENIASTLKNSQKPSSIKDGTSKATQDSLPGAVQKPVELVRMSSPTKLAGTATEKHMSPPHVVSSDRKCGLKIKIKIGGRKMEIKETGAAGRVAQADPIASKTDNWVQCDKCCKWRMLPSWIDPDELSIKWSCSQIGWLAPGMNNCNITENQSTAAVNNLYLPHLSSPDAKNSSKPREVQLDKVPPVPSISLKRPSEAASIDSELCWKKRKLNNGCLLEKSVGPDCSRSSVKEGTLTSTSSSCVVDRQEKGRAAVFTGVPSNKSYLLLNEARDLKHRADRLKSAGEDALCFTLYFEAALKFIKVASIWEHELGETNQAMQMYSDTATLCQYCANQCENQKNMPAAALAYKAIEVAYMKAAFLRSPARDSKDADRLGEDMSLAFQTTQRYQVLMAGELTGSVMEFLNVNFFGIDLFMQKARQALESIH